MMSTKKPTWRTQHKIKKNRSWIYFEFQNILRGTCFPQAKDWVGWRWGRDCVWRLWSCCGWEGWEIWMLTSTSVSYKLILQDFVLLCPAPLLSNTSTGYATCTAPSPLRNKCHSKMLLLLQVPLSTFCKSRVSMNFEASRSQNTDSRLRGLTDCIHQLLESACWKKGDGSPPLLWNQQPVRFCQK